jgi:hypothetical protein
MDKLILSTAEVQDEAVLYLGLPRNSANPIKQVFVASVQSIGDKM